MRRDGKAEIQHYVPKHALLKNFAGGKTNGQVYVFDKLENRTFTHPTSIKNIAAERRFYEAETPFGTVSFEEELTALEDKAAPAIEKLIENQSLRALDQNEFETLALFVAAQFIRVPRMRDTQKQLRSAVIDKARKIAPDAKNLSEIEGELEENAIKFASLRHLLGSTLPYAEIVRRHHWLLLKATSDEAYWISDCPVVLHNQRTFGPYGNIGIALPGIEIYLPISPHLSIAIWHRDIIKQRQNDKTRGIETYMRARETFHTLNLSNRQEFEVTLNEYKDKLEKAVADETAIKEGRPVDVSGDHVIFQNSLQYDWCSRFIFSADPNFDLAFQIAADRAKSAGGIIVRTD